MVQVAVPAGIFKQDRDTLVIRWNDGRESRHAFRRLRSLCPCAACVNEWTGQRMLDPGKVSEDIHPMRLFSVGRYAMAIHWSDGHTTGIYAYDFLRKLGENDANSLT